MSCSRRYSPPAAYSVAWVPCSTIRPSASTTIRSACWTVARRWAMTNVVRSEEHTSELQSRSDLVCRLLLEKKKNREHDASFVMYEGTIPYVESVRNLQEQHEDAA